MLVTCLVPTPALYLLLVASGNAMVGTVPPALTTVNLLTGLVVKNPILPVPLGTAVMLPLRPLLRTIAPLFVPLLVLIVSVLVPFVVNVDAALESPTRTVSAFIKTSPVPFGSIVILPLTPLAMIMLPLLVPALVLIVKSPVPFVVIVAVALTSPTRTVSAVR